MTYKEYIALLKRCHKELSTRSSVGIEGLLLEIERAINGPMPSHYCHKATFMVSFSGSISGLFGTPFASPIDVTRGDEVAVFVSDEQGTSPIVLINKFRVAIDYVRVQDKLVSQE
jgi:hypothetical protein